MADATKNDQLIDDNLNKIDSETDAEREKNDSEEILKKDYIEEPAPKYHIDLFGFKYQLDRSTVLTFVPGIIIYIATFVLLGLHNSECIPLKATFVISILFWGLQIHNRRNEKVQHISGESTSKHRARDSTIVILSIMTLFTVLGKSKSPLLGIGILILIGGSFWYTHEDLPLHYRFARNTYVTCLTTALMMFALYIVQTFICNNK